MNDEGAVAGYLVPGGPLFAAYPGQPLTLIANGGTVYDMNNAGVVVGSDNLHQAFAWLPQTAAFFNLNPVFGWTSGSATSISDHGDIVGDGIPPQLNPPYASFGEIPLSQINNSGQITGAYPGENNTAIGFLYSPGQPLVTFSSGSTPYQLNNAGHLTLVTETPQQYFGATRYYSSTALYRPGQPPIPVFDTTLLPRGLNDSDAILGNPTVVFGPSVPTLWTPTAGAVPIQNLIPPESGLGAWAPQAINNRGQILTWVYLPAPGFGSTSVILTPQTAGSPTGASTARAPLSETVTHRRPPRTGAASSDCHTLTLNGRPVC